MNNASLSIPTQSLLSCNYSAVWKLDHHSSVILQNVQGLNSNDVTQNNPPLGRGRLGSVDVGGKYNVGTLLLCSITKNIMESYIFFRIRDFHSSTKLVWIGGYCSNLGVRTP